MITKLGVVLFLVLVGLAYVGIWKILVSIGWTPILVLFLAVVLCGLFWDAPKFKPNYWVPRRR